MDDLKKKYIVGENHCHMENFFQIDVETLFIRVIHGLLILAGTCLLVGFISWVFLFFSKKEILEKTEQDT